MSHKRLNSCSATVPVLGLLPYRPAAIILGVNLVRYSGHVRVSGFLLALGVIALLAGLARLWRHDLPLMAMLFILMGVSLVLKPLVRKHAPGEGR